MSQGATQIDRTVSCAISKPSIKFTASREPWRLRMRKARPPSRPTARSSRSGLRLRVELEEAAKIRGGCCGHFFCAQVSHRCNRLSYFGDIGGFIALAAIGLRRKERRVRFDQYFLERQSFRNVANVCSLRIG